MDRGGRDVEEEPLHGGADHPGAEGGRRRRQGRRGLPQARGDADDLLPLEVEVRRDGGLGREAPQHARGRKPAPQADGRRPEPGPAGSEDGDPKKMVRPAAFRLAVGLVMKEFDLSLRRACRVLGFNGSRWHYQSRRVEPKGLLARLRTLASKRPRWGYRMLHLMLRREGHAINHKRVYRLYKMEGLAVRQKLRKRMAALARTVLPAPSAPNERWSMDFVSDVTAAGRRFRIFAVVDDFTREVLTLVVDTSIGGLRVCRELAQIAACAVSRSSS